MVKLKKKESLEVKNKSKSNASSQIVQEDYSTLVQDKNIQDPEFARMLLRARQRMINLKKDPSNCLEKEKELARSILNGTAKLTPIDEILREI